MSNRSQSVPPSPVHSPLDLKLSLSPYSTKSNSFRFSPKHTVVSTPDPRRSKHNKHISRRFSIASLEQAHINSPHVVAESAELPHVTWEDILKDRKKNQEQKELKNLLKKFEQIIDQQQQQMNDLKKATVDLQLQVVKLQNENNRKKGMDFYESKASKTVKKQQPILKNMSRGSVDMESMFDSEWEMDINDPDTIEYVTSNVFESEEADLDVPEWNPYFSLHISAGSDQIMLTPKSNKKCHRKVDSV